MKFVSFRIRSFRCFLDSGWIDVDTNVLPIIGQNESGKTTLLQALALLDREADGPDASSDWPIDAAEASSIDKVAVEARFTVEDGDEAPEGVPVGATLTVARTYDRMLRYSLADLPVPEYPQELRTILNRNLRALTGSQAVSSRARALRPAGLPPRILLDRYGRLKEAVEATEGMEQLAAELVGVEVHLAGQQKYAAFERWAQEKLPRFRYFDSYELVPGQFDVAAWAAKPTAEDTEAEARFLLLAELADLELSALNSIDRTPSGVVRRKSMVRTASHRLTGRVARLWSQREIDTSFDIDGETITVYVTDSLRNTPVPLDSRSAGFRWFYSFYVLFAAQQEGQFDGDVLLLDEPGVRLHGRAQKDLVAAMAELSKSNSIMYSTHSPFMIPMDNLDDVLVVWDGPESGSQIKRSVTGFDGSDSLPTQFALGFDLAQLYFGRRNHLIVEGWSDCYFLLALSEVLIADGRADPLRDTSVLPAASASNVPNMVRLSLANGHRVRVLLDSDPAGDQAQKKLQGENSIPAESVLRIDDALEKGSMSTIEDVIGANFYRQLTAAAYAEELRAAGLPNGPQVGGGPGLLVDRVHAAYEKVGIRISKTRVARSLLEDARSGDAAVPSNVKKTAARLFELIGAAKGHST